MKKIVCLLSVIGCSNFIFAGELLASQQCFSLENDERDVCLDKTYKEWDKKLNVAYNNLMKLIDEKTMKQIRHIQRRWIGLRDDRCIYNIDDEENTKKCLIDETVKQVDRLEQKIIKYDNALKQPLPDKQFEGIWEHCSYLDEQDKEICTLNYIIQDGNKLCGSYESFTTNKYIDIKYIGIVNTKDSLLADITKCSYDDSGELIRCENNKEIDNNKLKLLLCKNNYLYFTENHNVSCDELSRDVDNPYIRLYNQKTTAKEQLISYDHCSGNQNL